MKPLIAAALLLAMVVPSYAAETQCGRVRRAENGIMTKEGKFAVVRVNPLNDRYACWQIYNTLSEARAALAKR